MPKPDRYDLKANIPVDLRLSKIYMNEGKYDDPFIRVIAHIREPEESDYVYRSILGDLELLGQFYQLGFAQAEDKLNEDNLPFVETLRDGVNDILRILLEEHRNDRSGKKYTKARITHYWDGETWQIAPEPIDAPAIPAPPPRTPGGPQGAQTTTPPPGPPGPAPGPAAPPPGPAQVAQEAPGAIPEGTPQAPPVPAPVTGKTKHDFITVGYNYHIARCLVQAAGVSGDDVVSATTTVYIELMRNDPKTPSAWFRGRFQVTQDASGDDDLPFT